MTTKMLLLDESLLVQRVVELAFRDKGVDVEIVENADDALEIAEKAPPDVVVASLDMENSDGLGFCRRMREMPNLSQVPLLVLTSTRQSVSDEDIQEVGAMENIEKPFKPVVFTDAVERIIAPVHSGSIPDEQDEPAVPGTAMREETAELTPSAAEDTLEEMGAAPTEAEGASTFSAKDEQPSFSPAPVTLDSETLAPIIQKHLEEAVESIAPTLLSQIEDTVVKQLPYIVEKIVIREIEKIKRGE